MQVEKNAWQKATGWEKPTKLSDAGLVIYFGSKDILANSAHFDELKQHYPNADIVGCSTGGEIYGDEVRDDSIATAAIQFKKTEMRTISVDVTNMEESFNIGKELAEKLSRPDLKHIMVFSDGTNINGSDLIRGVYSVVDDKVIVTGGLAGDGANFKSTLVGLNTAPKEKCIAAIGFYGNSLNIQYGSVGGWNGFGPERIITKSDNNILYELDGKPALDLYKEYLGENAAGLPGSALLFPLSIRPTHDSEHDIVRTVVGIDEDKKAMIFAGDMPEGHVAQLMMGDSNDLVDGATEAANLVANDNMEQSSLAILVSCIGRKLLLGQKISDETEAVADIFHHKVPTIGFYSYGEICHQQFTGKCSLHNQTMTITLLSENDT